MAVDRQVRLFCELLAEEGKARGKPFTWFMSLADIADRLGVSSDQVDRLARRCAALDLVDISSGHSVRLAYAGHELVRPRPKAPAKRRKRPS